MSVKILAKQYFLTEGSIRRIIRKQKILLKYKRKGIFFTVITMENMPFFSMIINITDLFLNLVFILHDDIIYYEDTRRCKI